jgi:DNA replication protein DnaC
MKKVHASPLRTKDHQWPELERIREATVYSCDRGCTKGYIEKTEDGFTQLCDCLSTYLLLKQYVLAGIPKTYWPLTLETLEVEEFYKDTVRQYASNLDQALANALGIMFMGSNGIGKTSMMIEIGKAAITEHFGVRYLTLSQYLIAALGKNEELLEDIDASDFILLDELDKAVVGKSDWPAKTAEEFIRQTIALGKGLIIASNLDDDALREQFGESLVSALQRNLLLMPVEGDDYSTRLQSDLQASWQEKLSGEVNYYATPIVERARARENVRIEVERKSWSPYFVR